MTYKPKKLTRLDVESRAEKNFRIAQERKPKPIIQDTTLTEKQVLIILTVLLFFQE